jgi:hypothetical protein
MTRRTVHRIWKAFGLSQQFPTYLFPADAIDLTQLAAATVEHTTSPHDTVHRC